MHIRKTALALLLAGLLLPAAGWAQEGRLNGNFYTEDETQQDDNEACTSVDGTDFGIGGRVVGLDGDCKVSLTYFTVFPHKASATNSSAKVSQSSHVFVEVTIEDDEAFCPTENKYVGSAEPEDCKAIVSLKGTSVAQADDEVQSSKLTMSCDLGRDGDELGPNVPTPEVQFQTIVNAFANRDDVKLDSKGRLKLTHAGVPDPDPNALCATEVP